MHQTEAPLGDAALTTLVTDVRSSVFRATRSALDELADSLSGPIVSLSVRAWPHDFPTDIATLRRVPYESRADSVMYCQVLAEVAAARGWAVHTFNASSVEADAARILGERSHEVLHGPRRSLGPPWSKDHRIALAATVVAAAV